jgi:hypothetical protein
LALVLRGSIVDNTGMFAVYPGEPPAIGRQVCVAMIPPITSNADVMSAELSQMWASDQGNDFGMSLRI